MQDRGGHLFVAFGDIETIGVEVIEPFAVAERGADPAAVGNHVTGLHRSSFGALQLPADLLPGQWAWVEGLAAIEG